MQRRLSTSQALLIDLYELTMAQGYWEANKAKQQATFELFVRRMPPQRGYLLNAGLEDALNYIESLRFSRQDIAYLRKQDLFKEGFLDYLSAFKFRGDAWAMAEGEIFFANEPLIRVSGNIIETQILESFLLNTINLQVMIATKAARVVVSAQGRSVFDFSLRRTHGCDAALKVGRSSYIAGFAGTSNVLAGKTYTIPLAGTMAHSFVMCFEKEIDSLRSYARSFPDKSILLVDTYDTRKGIAAAIKVGQELKKQGYRLLGIRLDSGNLALLSRMARKMFDQAGLRQARIFASGNLDEYKIKELLRKGAIIDSFGVGTKMGVSDDAPFLDIIYKISEVTDGKGNFLPTMKLSKNKTTFPGRKQVYRRKDAKGRFSGDVLALEKEKAEGKPLLKEVMRKGKIIYALPAPNQIRNYARLNLDALLPEYKRLFNPAVYPVVISRGLKRLTRELVSEIKKRQHY